jgi:acetyl-CoA carboxylase carboxyltransferase component
MPVLSSAVDSSSDEFDANRSTMLEKIAEVDRLTAEALAGGGPKYVERHRKRGKLMVRERLELLLDRDSPFLELSTLSAANTEFHTGASGVHGIGVVSGVECVISGHDPTVRGGSSNPYTLGKSLRAQDIARENRLPLINLVESGGADLPNQHKVFIPGGKWFRNMTQLSKLRIPTIALVFGSSTAGGAYVPGMADYAVMVQDRAKVFLGGPPLVKMATGEESTDEELGGAEMHSRVSGLSDYLARDEHDAIRIGRQIVRHLGWRKLGYGPTEPPDEPIHAAEEILGLIPPDLKKPMDMREILARIVDGSRFDEYKREYGRSLVTGWASIHGFRIGVLANQQGVLFSEEANKATEFIQLCNVYDQPLLFLHNVTGYMVGAAYEQRGIIKDGAKMINAVANSTVPHISVIAGASYGAGNYGMSGQSYNTRFVFTWPSAKVAVMGGEQLAGVLSIINRAAAESRGQDFDEEHDATVRRAVEDQIHHEETAQFMTAHNRDDGIIDPRDTRSVLGMALSAVHSNAVEGTTEWGVFRM